ncbi:hypothetical protein AURDEDRAFT_161439 [Auricularia subglabra TFB-10046 SS5]|nr:hypothetical protein AURDEDRAFT_161439 [Auricularia subglabra TFB-10046 SS5]
MSWNLNSADTQDAHAKDQSRRRLADDSGARAHHPGSPSGTAHRGPSPSQTIRSSSVATLSADSHASPGGSNAGYEIYPENGRNAFGFTWVSEPGGYLFPAVVRYLTVIAAQTIPSEADMASLRPGERRRWVDYARKCQVFDPNGDGPAPTPVGYGLSATPSPVPSRLASPYAPPAATYPSPQAHAGHFSPQESASQYTHSAAPSRAGSAALSPDLMQQPTHNRWASPSPSVYAHSAATSRASSASLTPEPEQRFHCPDCSVDFGCRDWLHLHLRGQYQNGVCPSSY